MPWSSSAAALVCQNEALPLCRAEGPHDGDGHPGNDSARDKRSHGRHDELVPEHIGCIPSKQRLCYHRTEVAVDASTRNDAVFPETYEVQSERHNDDEQNGAPAFVACPVNLSLKYNNSMKTIYSTAYNQEYIIEEEYDTFC